MGLRDPVLFVVCFGFIGSCAGMWLTGESPVLVPGTKTFTDPFLMPIIVQGALGGVFGLLIAYPFDMIQTNFIVHAAFCAFDYLAITKSGGMYTDLWWGFLAADGLAAVTSLQRGFNQVGGIVNLAHVLQGIHFMVTGTSPFFASSAGLNGLVMSFLGWKLAGCAFMAAINLKVDFDTSMLIFGAGNTAFAVVAALDTAHFTQLFWAVVVFDSLILLQALKRRRGQVHIKIG